MCEGAVLDCGKSFKLHHDIPGTVGDTVADTVATGVVTMGAPFEDLRLPHRPSHITAFLSTVTSTKEYQVYRLKKLAFW